MKKTERDRPEPPLLLCGEYTALQTTRADVLRLVGFSVETVSSQEVEQRLGERRYALLLLCQSLGEEEIDRLTTKAAEVRVRTYVVAALITPDALIEDVTTRARDRQEVGGT